MLQQNPLQLVRALKGAPLSCIFAMAILHQPVTARYLATVTGYHPNTVTPALQLLAELQLATCNPARSAWQLSTGVLQLPLPLFADHNLCDPAAATTATALIGSEPLMEGQQQLADHNLCDRCTQAFAAHGVGTNNALLDLCSDPDITPEFINAQAQRLKDENRFSPALLVHVVRSRDPMPTPPANDRTRYITGEFAEYINH